jgi:CubicO group peptidase (beta-lactamase class C family)
MGLTKEGLRRLDLTLEEHVRQGFAPGLVALVACGEATHVLVKGRMSIDCQEPMRRDSIFRIASMTKPITALAALQLIEAGKLRLDEPVDRLLPELANRRVLRTLASTLDDTVAPARPITVEDLLTFRLGMGLVFDRDLPIQSLVAGLPGFGMPDPSCPLTPDEYMQRLQHLPLMAQPGERWLYTTGSNVLGVLIARAAGKPLDMVLQEEIFGPLGMADTGFWIPRNKLDRTVTGYRPDRNSLVLFDAPDGKYARPPAFPAGDGGLVSTADDFAAFAKLLLTGRTLHGLQLIGEASLRAMQSNHLTPPQIADGQLIMGPGWGWGYGVGVVVDNNPYGISRGAYGWNGGFGTSWFNDPGRQLTAVLLTQRVFDSPDPPQIHKDFWAALMH